MSENLYQRGGVWWIRYNVDGRTVRRSLQTDSLKEAKRLKNEVLGARDAARAPRSRLGLAPIAEEKPEPRPVPTLDAVAKVWRTHREADADLSDQAREKTCTALDVHILPVLGSRIMSTITREDVEAFVAKLRAKPGRKDKASPTTVSNTFVQLRALVRFAIRRSLYDGRDFTDIDKPPRPGPGRDVILTVDEAKGLLVELDGRWHVMASVALYAGLRWGEVNGLKWEDIELEATQPTLTISRSYRDGTPKTEESCGTLPLHDELVAVLKRWKKQSNSEWLFPARKKGGPAKTHATEADYEALADAAKRAKIAKHVTPHVFRHSFGTLLYETTEDPKAVQRLMRHRSLATTMKYVHDRRELGGKVNALPSLGTQSPRLRAV